MRLQRWQRSHHGHRDMGCSPSAGRLAAASFSKAAGCQRIRSAVLWHHAGRHRQFWKEMPRCSSRGHQGAHRAAHEAPQKAAANLGGDESPPFLFPSRASFSQRGPLMSSGCHPRGSIAAANNHQGVARTTSRCHTPAVVSTLLTPLPVSCPLTTPLHYTYINRGPLWVL